NTVVGSSALNNMTTGNNNIALGLGAGGSLTSGDNNIFLGNSGAPTESQTMRFGIVGTHTRAFMAGIFGVHLDGTPVYINAAGQLGVQPSSARYKSDIAPMGTHSRGLFQLRPVLFRYKQDPQGERQYGLIAEEVAKVYPELVTRNAQD